MYDYEELSYPEPELERALENDEIGRGEAFALGYAACACDMQDAEKREVIEAYLLGAGAAAE